VLLRDVQAAQLGFEGVAAALAAGQAGGEHHAVVGEGGGWDAVGGDRGKEVPRAIGPVTRGVRGQGLMSFGVRAHVSVAGQA